MCTCVRVCLSVSLSLRHPEQSTEASRVVNIFNVIVVNKFNVIVVNIFNVNIFVVNVKIFTGSTSGGQSQSVIMNTRV